MTRASVVTDGMDAVASQYEALRDGYAVREQVLGSYVFWVQDSTYYGDHCLGTGIDYSGTNPSTVLNNCLSHGGKTFVKDGTYSLPSAVNATVDATVLEGESWNTIFTKPDNSDYPLIQVGNGTNIYYVKLKNFTVDGNGYLNPPTDMTAQQTNRYSAFQMNKTKRCFLDNLRITNTYGTGVESVGTATYECELNWIENSHIRYCYGYAIHLDQYSTDWHLSKLQLSSCGDFDSLLGFGSNAKIEGSSAMLTQVHSSGGDLYGIEVEATATAVKIINCEQELAQSHGIMLSGGSGTWLHGHQLIGCTIKNNGVTGGGNDHGVVLVDCNRAIISGNEIFNSAAAYNQHHGLYLSGSSDENIISNNIFRKNDGNGISMGNGCDYNQYLGNQFLDNVGSGIFFGTQTGSILQSNIFRGNASAVTGTLTNLKIRDNEGFVTENSGTGTIGAAATSETVAHGLDVTPTVDDFTITLAENPTNAITALWIDTIGAANFNVNVEPAPGASELDFGWRVVVL